MSNPNPPAPPARAPRWFLGAALIALAAYTIFLAGKTAATAGGSDSSGYLNSARLLATGRLQTELRLPPQLGAPAEIDRGHFTPMGFLPGTTPSLIVPTYPTGLPLHQALAAKTFGWRLGPMLVVAAGAVAGLWLCYLIARELGLSPVLAAAGAVMLAAFPVFLFSSIQALSDTLAMTWGLAAFYCALRARRSVNWAAACGAAFSIAVLVRPTNIMLAPALLVLLGFNLPRIARFTLSGLPAAAWMAFYNTHQYGGPLRSGYGDYASAFALAWGLPTFVHFAKWLALFLPGIVLALPLAALIHPATRGRELLALALAFAAIAGLYLFYDVSHDVWWCLRFILPVVPALILASLLGVEALARGPAQRWSRSFRPVVAALLCAWAIGSSWYWSRHLNLFLVQVYEQNYENAAIAAADRLPKNALVCASGFSGALYFYSKLAVLRSDLVTPAAFERYAAALRPSGRPVCAVIFDFEEAELRRNCPGHWSQFHQVANVGFWKLE